MNLVVIGASGRIGSQVTRTAVAAGHLVTAVARRPETVPGSHDNLTVVPGDVAQPETLAKPIAGADAVVFAVGSRGRGPAVVRSTGISAVARAMRTAGVDRLVTISPSAVAISPGAPLARKLALRFFVHKLNRNPYNDIERMEEELPYTDLDWAVIRSSALRDGPATGEYRVVPDGQLRGERRLSIGDLAAYVVGEATWPRTHRAVVTVTGAT